MSEDTEERPYSKCKKCGEEMTLYPKDPPAGLLVTCYYVCEKCEEVDKDE